MIGARLRLTREVYELSQKEFAAEIGIPSNQYNQYEQGNRRPFISVAQHIADRFHVSLDWIYDGKISHLSLDMITRLIRVANKLHDQPPKKKEQGIALNAVIEKITKRDFSN